MEDQKDKIFLKDPNKIYGLMEIVDGTSPIVEKKAPWYFTGI